MAESKIVSNLDRKLIEESILDPVYREDYQIVHSMLNERMRQTGKILTEETFKKGEDALREWLAVLSKQGASQEKLTSYLRCGLAHLCFDFIESTYETILTDDLLTRAMQSFKLRDYHKTYFKASGSSRKVTPKAAVKKSAKKTPAKKASVKKAAVKAVKKKPVKKTAVKKAAEKTVKKTVKKTEIKKKTAAKKKTPVKKSSLKAVKKKAAVKKAAAKKSSVKGVKNKAAVKKTVKKTSKKTEKKENSSFISRLFGK